MAETWPPTTLPLQISSSKLEGMFTVKALFTLKSSSHYNERVTGEVSLGNMMTVM